MSGSKSKSSSLKTVGRRELVSFPEWELFDLEAKVDTGAYTSSLHCHHIEKREGGNLVRFNLLDPSHDIYNEKLFELPIHKEKTVRSSNGVTEQRYIVKTSIVIYQEEPIDIELSLTDRSEMKYPVLLGRKLLKGRFLVDPSKKHLAKKKSRHKNDS
ncbi:MAG: RimK/LysX family protein [Balneolaceae bacterium]|nr:RimK/LysX family protein [Balneolaceae bacterium]